MKNIGINIKKIRKNKGMTQSEFASAAGISRSYLGDLENNRKNPSANTLRKLSDKFDVPISSLVDSEFVEKAYEIFRDVEKEVKSNYPLLTSKDKFNNFFLDIDKFREITFEDINKIGLFHEDDLRVFYYYRLGRSLPFDDSPQEFNIKVNILKTAGFYEESSIPPKEKVTNVIYDYLYKDKTQTINEKALIDTIDTIRDLSIEIEDKEIIFIYAQNEQFYDKTSDMRIKDTKSYIKYLKHTISEFGELYKQNPKLESYFEKHINYYNYLIKSLTDQ